MATYTIHQIPTSRAAIATDELEVQATGGGQSARVTAQSIINLVPTGPTGPSGPTGLAGGPSVWSNAATFNSGDLALDRGGIWLSNIDNNINSEPISGNANWTLVGGTPYVDVVIPPEDLASADMAGGLYQLVPPPGAGFTLLGNGYLIAQVSGGKEWTAGAITVQVGSNANPSQLTQWGPTSINTSLFFGTPNTYDTTPLENDYNQAGTDGLDNRGIYAFAQTPLTGGARSLELRIPYQIVPSPRVFAFSYYIVTAVNQGAKTFTVTDAGAALNGATGTFDVVGSTGNDGTYTIVSAVSGAGSTVITVVEAIPSATADGWCKFA